MNVLLNKVSVCSTLCAGVLFTACGTGVVVSSKEVPKEKFYHSLSASFDEGTGKTSRLVSFKDGSVYGDSIRLDEPAKVLADGAEMKTIDSRDFALLGILMPIPFLALSTAGYFYSADSSDGLKGEYRYSIVYPDASKAEISIPSFSSTQITNMKPGQNLATTTDVTFNLNPRTSVDGLRITCYLSYEVVAEGASKPSDKTILASSRDSGKTCTFAAKELAAIPAGSLRSAWTKTSSQIKGEDFKGFKTFEVTSAKMPLQNR